MNRLSKSESGIAHLGLVVLLVLIVGGIGSAGYLVYSKNDGTDSGTISQVESDISDSDLDDGSNVDDDPENNKVVQED